MRLLLDEHYSPVIAERLRDRGHHVLAVAEQPELVGLADADLFRVLNDERRALVTENWADFQRELRSAADAGTAHYGVVFTSRKRLPRGKAAIGLFVRVLDDSLGRRDSDEALVNSYCWLPETRLGSE